MNKWNGSSETGEGGGVIAKMCILQEEIEERKKTKQIKTMGI